MSTPLLLSFILVRPLVKHSISKTLIASRLSSYSRLASMYPSVDPLSGHVTMPARRISTDSQKAGGILDSPATTSYQQKSPAQMSAGIATPYASSMDPEGGTMQAWMTELFGAPLILNEQVPIPRVHGADQLLIRVKAASINPIDVRMAEGYGNEMLSLLKQVKSDGPLTAIQKHFLQGDGKGSRLPLITGRDCSGEVVEVGAQVKKYKKGDEVLAVVPVFWPGAHAEYVLTSLDAVAPKPKNISHVEAAAMAYTACTCWSALVKTAGLNATNACNNRVLIHGGSGGIGTTAIQLLKAWGSPKVVATCSAKNVSLVEGLGAIGVDYASPRAKERIVAEGPYEVVLDCVDSELSRWSDSIMGSWRNCYHVSLVSPLLGDTDRYGSVMGLVSSLVKLGARGACSAPQGKWFRYAFFEPSAECLEELSSLLELGKIKAVVENVYDFSHVPEAYERVGKGHAAGKCVIDFEKQANEQGVDNHGETVLSSATVPSQ